MASVEISIEQPPPAGPLRRVLIVDSDPSFGHSLEQDFRTRAFEVEMVATPNEAIERVAIARPISVEESDRFPTTFVIRVPCLAPIALPMVPLQGMSA